MTMQSNAMGGFRLALFAALAAVLSLWLAPAQAATLDQLKSQGLAGEMATGYVGYPQGSPAPDVRQTVESVNLERKARYGQIAQQQGTTLQVVEKLAGAKLVEQAPAGQYVQDSTGAWRQK